MAKKVKIVVERRRHKTLLSQGHIDSLRRDPAGTITADCPPVPPRGPVEQGQARLFL